LTLIGLKEGKEITEKRGEAKARIDKKIQDVSVNDFDALLIPGGYSPDHLRTDEEAVSFVRKFMESRKPSICYLSCPSDPHYR
jgi:protease I